MIKIGITGGIGSGKSFVASVLKEQYGIPVYDTDSRAKALMLTDATIRDGLIRLLGNEVYLSGQLNKPVLAAYLFASDENARQINSLVHPAVKRDFVEWADSQRTLATVVAVESAILFESGMDKLVDATVMVHAPMEVRISRTMQRDNATRLQVEKRIRAQMNDEQKCALSTYIIENDGVRSLTEQLEQLLNELNKSNSDK